MAGRYTYARLNSMTGKLGVAPSEETVDLAAARESLDGEHSAASEPIRQPPRQPRGRFLGSASARRALLMVLGGLLFGGVIAVLESGADANHPGSYDHRPGPTTATRADVVLSSAHSGDCLIWPKNAPDQPSFVQCKDPHLFEVAQSVDMRNMQAPCQQAVQRYLGSYYDPNSKFMVAALWSGAGTQPGERHLLCGLQLPGPDSQPVPFTGQVAELDQSKVWPPGTCLGVESATNQPTDTPVDCAAPHALEVTGAVNLAEKFSGPPPAEPDQDAFIRDACTRTADAYLSPVGLRTTALALQYSTVSPASWSAGSHQVSCGVGAPLDNNQGWAALTGSAKGEFLINGHAHVPTTSVPAPREPEPEPRVEPPPTAADTPSPAPTQPSPTPTAAASPSQTATPSPSASATTSPEAVPSPTSDAPPAA
jgi:hypothetical protein